MKRAELRNIHKTFETPSDSSGTTQHFTALDGVNISFLPGEIHTILGENGAGKSTLMNILSGLHQPTAGSIRIGGQDFIFKSPSEALTAGIAMVHQRPLLSDDISVLENTILGSSRFLLHRHKKAKEIRSIAQKWHIKIDLGAPTRTLTPSNRLYTALLSALYRKPDFLILDEPTAVLVPEEKEQFFLALQQAKTNGLGIILITHNIVEALRWSDRISVLQEGRLIFTSLINSTNDTTTSTAITEEFLTTLINPEMNEKRTRSEKNSHVKDSADVFFRLENINAEPKNRNPIYTISFNARKNCITGIFGFPLSGLETLEDILSGMIHSETGTFAIDTKTIPARIITPAILRQEGVAFVPSDRGFRGAHPELTIFDMLTVYRCGKRILPGKANSDFVRNLLKDEKIDAPFSRTVQTLSGGQLQRLIVARELATKPRVIILAEPEWGLDIRSIALLRSRLKAEAEAGVTVIILTDDFEEDHDSTFFTDSLFLREGKLS